MTEDQIKHMVDRFLGWKLPQDFHPDCGIKFDADAAVKMNPRNSRYEPVGTNLFTATQADAMVRYLIEDMPTLGEEVSAGRIRELWKECGGKVEKGRFWIEPDQAPHVVRKIIATITEIAYRARVV